MKRGVAAALTLALLGLGCAKERGLEHYERGDPEWPQVEQLHRAVHFGDLAAVKRALRNGMHPDVRGKEEKTPLMVAAGRGHLELVEYLLESGARVNARNQFKQFALMHAAASTDVEIVRRLIAAGADLDAADRRGYTALHVAAERGYLEVVTALLLAGADPTAGESRASAAALARERRHLRVVSLIESAGSGAAKQRPSSAGDSDAPSRPLLSGDRRDREHALVEAAAKGDWTGVEELLGAGVDPDALDDDGRTALMAAAWNGHLKTVEVLLDAYVGVDERQRGQGHQGLTALGMAVSKKRLEIVRVLLAAGADPDLGAPLKSAVRYSSKEIAEALLDSGAGVDPEDSASYLASAVADCDEDMVDRLLSAGADGSRARMPAKRAEQSDACRRVFEMLGGWDEEEPDGPVTIPM